VAKPELGTKRLCGNCGAKFYDLSKDPIVCPKCDTVLVLAPISSSRRPDSRSAAARGGEDVVTPETQDADFVSLEDADAEAEGKKTKDADAIDGDDDLELDEALDDDDASLIEEEEETDDDVTDIIGDREDEEEP
jgi:uncharacterized protein (TIGR02300 family)